MILILSDENDISTEQVIDWLNLFNKDFKKIDLTEIRISDFEK